MKRLALLLVLLLVPTMAPAQDFPKLSGRVVDAANILPPDVEARIAARSEAIEQQTTAQVVVATVPSLDGYEIEDYGYRLGRAWGIGQKRGSDKSGGAATGATPTGVPTGDNGVILLVAPNDRKVRIEVGYGLEPVLTDALSSVIIQRAIIPEFRAGNMPGGVEAGFDAIAKQLELPPEEAAKNVAAAQGAGSGGDGGFPIQLIFFLILLVIWIMLASRRGKGGRRARRGGPIVVWGPGMGGGGWGGGGGGGFGGGGFGGGGGGFGGGGASGGW